MERGRGGEKEARWTDGRMEGQTEAYRGIWKRGTKGGCYLRPVDGRPRRLSPDCRALYNPVCLVSCQLYKQIVYNVFPL